MRRLRKIIKKILQSWRKFKRRPYRKSLKEWEVFQDLLGRFETSYETSYDLGNKSHERNMEIILKNLNNRVVLKGEHFSFNQTVGERKLERGFKEGPIVIRGQMTKGLAGGICQVTSTLYNAILLSNLKVIERKHHPRIQKYVPAGRDATVYFDLIDLVFKNNRKSPIKLKTKIDKVNGIISFEIWGKNIENINVKINTTKKETKKYIIFKTYRKIYNEGRLIKIEKISKDKYKKD